MVTDELICQYSGLPSPASFAEGSIAPLSPSVEALALQREDRIIEMAWEDRTPFEAIQFQFGLNEAQVKAFMKKQLKAGSYKLWRTRVENCKTKHAKKRSGDISRFKCSLQRNITMNKISKRRSK